MRALDADAGFRVTPATRTRARGLRWAAVLGPAPAVLGLVAWVVAISRIRLGDADLFGLLPIAGPFFYAALGLIVGGFVLELARAHRRPWVLLLHVVALVVVIHATIPALSGTPEYAWVYKHIGVVEALGQNGRVTDPNDIYQQWPALFAGVAAISGLSGVSPMRFAAWAPLFFQLANVLLLLGIFRSLAVRTRTAFVAVALYECLVCWVGQDYLSPQAFAYLLWLGVLLVVLRSLRRARPLELTGRRFLRMRGWLLRDLPRARAARPSRTAAVLIAIGLFATVVVSHQLTPYAALAGLAGLTVLGVLRPRWLVVAMAAIAAGFLASRYHVISSQYGGLLSGDNPIGNASGTASAGWHSAAQAFTATVVRALAIGMWLLTLLVVALHVRRPGRVLIPAVLAFAPFAVLFGQSYGGEAIYRVFLFSAPWCALILALGIARLAGRSRRALVGGVVIAVALVAGLQGLYGPVAVNAFSATQVTASDWLYAHAPSGATFVLAAENFPALQTADYADHPVLWLPADPQMGEAWLRTDDEPMVERWAATLGPKPVYLVISANMVAYANYFGFPDGLSGLERNVAASRRWTPVYRNADTTIYRFDSAGG